MRLTLDSNILVRALASPQGTAFRLLDIIRRAHTLVLSRFILDEVERVILYPRLRARYGIAASEAARFTWNLANVADMVEPVIVRPVVLSDPADDSVLYTAADGKAEVLCTREVTEIPRPMRCTGSVRPRHDGFRCLAGPFEVACVRQLIGYPVCRCRAGCGSAPRNPSRTPLRTRPEF